MSNKVWVTWRDVSGEQLASRVLDLPDDAIVDDLRTAFVAQQFLSVSPASIQVREKEDGEELKASTRNSPNLKPSDPLLPYFVPPAEVASAPGPGRSEDSPLFLFFPPPPAQLDLSVIAKLVEQNQKINDEKEEMERSITMNKATVGKRYMVLRLLGVKVVGAQWCSQPKKIISKRADTMYKWIANVDKDNPRQIKAYMKFLKRVLSLPKEYDFANCTGENSLLSVDITFPKIKFKGTTDVLISQRKNIRNNALRQNAAALIGLKRKKQAETIGMHEPQAIVEHTAASILNSEEGVVTILTDLNEEWILYWFDHTGRSLLKLVASRKEAQFLLENLIPHTGIKSAKMPQDFWHRGTMATVLMRSTQSGAREPREDDTSDDEESKGPTPRKKPRKDGRGNAGDGNGGSGGVAQPKLDRAGRTTRRQNRGNEKQQSRQGKNNAFVSQVMDSVDSDLADEFRTADEDNERMDIARRFVTRYMLSNLVAPLDNRVVESASGHQVPDTINF